MGRRRFAPDEGQTGFSGRGGWHHHPGEHEHDHDERGHHEHGHRGRGGGPRGERGERRGRGGPNPWDPFGASAGGRSGPPPWVTGLFGIDEGERRRGPRVRRGDVRAAILDVLREAEAGDPVNGYQVIQRIAERSGEAWKPSPGSVYPTIQQLEDEGLVEKDAEKGRGALGLTDLGRTWVAEHAEELDAVWAPFEERERAERATGPGDLRPQIGQVMGAVWQITTTGTDSQRAAAVEVLSDARRRLYGILADGDAGSGAVEGSAGE